MIRMHAGKTYLQHCLREHDHFLSDLLDDEVLDLEPLLVVTSASAGAEVDLPDGALLVTGRACSGLVRDVGDQVIDGRRVRGRSVKICAAAR